MDNRLRNEYRNINKMKDTLSKEGITITPKNSDNLSNWTISILTKDKDSPYLGQTHTICVKIPRDYPLSPPECNFTTPMFHPNVKFTNGEICLNILTKDDWSPAISLISLAQSIAGLCSAPNTDSPLNCDASNLVKNGDVRAVRCICQYYYKGEYTAVK
ncbi:Ubiquitin-conjugating enzyme E2-17 kDa [Giardia duodenalis assemblage B]|uniref:Ubiquitin-conjugating enzyme E2-17 kDa n=3 Tax=Giardia intestinalis TaxID=5741 RepID=A0A132NSE9_GIAIN|nr:Ubiquitin-conjugating enzyme E2-17 kDa [Giardia intestinalis ATCC 50581]ESU43876.1 Ubiquitin-conjugating enzyme E2 [Giardia intestinalis]KWX12928.1 Ubiquitin-conjugating enzyme E2-17 kDa [Giardia intestinalis assemblage B]